MRLPRSCVNVSFANTRPTLIRRKSSRARLGARGRLRFDMIGSSPRRKEDKRLLTGHGGYVDDVTREGTLNIGVVGRTQAEERLTKVATEAGSAMSGVGLAW